MPLNRAPPPPGLHYLRVAYGPYFSNTYGTPWGDAINYDGPHSDEVRRFFIENALYWLTEFRMDALRLDAIHGIRDFSARPFLQELAEAVRERGDLLNRRLNVFAESSLNDARAILPTWEATAWTPSRGKNFATPDPLLLYGLPTSRVEDMGNHLAMRFQRAVIQQWTEDTPWASAGEVTLANGGDIAREEGMFPREAIIP